MFSGLALEGSDDDDDDESEEEPSPHKLTKHADEGKQKPPAGAAKSSPASSSTGVQHISCPAPEADDDDDVDDDTLRQMIDPSAGIDEDDMEITIATLKALAATWRSSL